MEWKTLPLLFVLLLGFLLWLRQRHFHCTVFRLKSQTKQIDEALFHGTPKSVQQLNKQARKELRLKKREEFWKARQQNVPPPA